MISDGDRIRKLTGERPPRGGYQLYCSQDVADEMRGSLPAWTRVMVVGSYDPGQWRLVLVVPLGIRRRVRKPPRCRRPGGRKAP